MVFGLGIKWGVFIRLDSIGIWVLCGDKGVRIFGFFGFELWKLKVIFDRVW